MAGASRRSLAERLEAWSGVCDAAAAGELADADASAALVSVVFASLREHDDKPSRVALARAVDAALTHSPAFLKAFAARLLKAASDTPQAMEPTRRRELLRWSCALVRHLDLATHAGAFAKVNYFIFAGLVVALIVAIGSVWLSGSSHVVAANLSSLAFTPEAGSCDADGKCVDLVNVTASYRPWAWSAECPPTPAGAAPEWCHLGGALR